MTNAIIPAAIRLHDRPLLDMTHDSVEVSHCVPYFGTLRTDAAGVYFDHSDGNTYHWSLAAWQIVSIEEATGWGLIVPDKPQPWITIVRHAYADRNRRQIAAHTARRLP